MSHEVSRRLTSLGPQPPHRRRSSKHIPRSVRFDRIFRNEGVTGSNPVSSTQSPCQGGFLAPGRSAGVFVRVCNLLEDHLEVLHQCEEVSQFFPPVFGNQSVG